MTGLELTVLRWLRKHPRQYDWRIASKLNLPKREVVSVLEGLKDQGYTRRKPGGLWLTTSAALEVLVSPEFRNPIPDNAPQD